MPFHPLITIITPAYNAAATIAETIRSVQAQTYPHWEWIIVDDGSTDSTCAIIQQFNDPRIHLLSTVHTGLPGKGRNTALAQARGNYIAFIDADDLWIPDKLSLQIDYLTTLPSVGLVFSTYYEWNSDDPKPGRLVPNIRGLPNPGMLLRELCTRFFIGTSSVVVRRSLLDTWGGFDETLDVAEDYELWLRLAPHTLYGFIDRPLMCHRLHTHNLTRSPVYTIECSMKARHKAFANNPDVAELLAPLRLRLPAQSLMELGRAWLLEGDQATGRRLLAQAVRIWPFAPRIWLWFGLSFVRANVLAKLRRLVLAS